MWNIILLQFITVSLKRSEHNTDKTKIWKIYAVLLKIVFINLEKNSLSPI